MAWGAPNLTSTQVGLPRRSRLPPRPAALPRHRFLRARALDHGRPHRPRPRPRGPLLRRPLAPGAQGLEPVARHQQERVEPRREVLALRRRGPRDPRGADAASTPPHAIAATLTVARRRRSSSSSSGRRSRSGARASSGAPRASRSPTSSRAARAARSEYIAPSSHYSPTTPW